MMHEKATIGEIAKTSRGIAHWTPQGELTTTPSCNSQRAKARFVMV